MPTKSKGFTVKDNRGKEKTQAPPSTDGALAHQQTNHEQTIDTEEEEKASEPATSSLELVEKFDPFRGGLERYAEEGRLEMRNGHVLVYAIMTGDASSFGVEQGDKLGHGIIDTKKAIAWEIRGLAPDIPDSANLHEGMAIRHLSATAAPINGQDKSCRWYQLWYGDVTCAVWPDEEVTEEDPETGDVITKIVPRGQTVEAAGTNVTGPYPWQARAMGGGKAWCVVDADGDVMGDNISQQRAEQIADRVNMKAGFQGVDSNQKVAATFDAAELPEVKKPQPIRTPAPAEDVSDDDMLDGLGPDQVSIMLPLITSGDLAAARAIRPQLLRLAAMQSNVDEVVDRQEQMDISHLPPEVKTTILSIEKSLGLEQALQYKENWEANNLEKKKSPTAQPSRLTRTTPRSSVRRR